MPEPQASTDAAVDHASVKSAGFAAWRRAHLCASFALGALAILHSALTVVLFEAWSDSALWFLGTGLGLLLLAGMNVAHVGLEPCTLPTARAVNVANWVFVLFGIGALRAVPEPQAFIIVAALLVQAVSGRRTFAARPNEEL